MAMGRGEQPELAFAGGLSERCVVPERHEDMDLQELLEELELSHPEKVAEFERRHYQAMEAVEAEDLDSVDPELLDDLREDLVSLLRV